MENFKVTLNIEPTDDYAKAKMDLLKALESIRALPPHLQQHLAEEMFGAQAVAVLTRILQQY